MKPNAQIAKKEVILIIDHDVETSLERERKLLELLPNVEVITTSSALEGIGFCRDKSPRFVIINFDMPGFNGMIICSIVRQMKVCEQLMMYVCFDNDSNMSDRLSLAYQVGFDCCFTKGKDEENILGSIKRYYEKKKALTEYFDDVERLRRDQEKMLPKKINRPDFSVDHIYSPFHKLSGDFFDFWYVSDKNGLCGYIFDVTGHDLTSAYQVKELRVLFRHAFGFYEDSIGKVLQYVNKELFLLYGEPTLVAALTFRFDFNTDQLFFCSAGIPSFFIAERNEFLEIEMAGNLLGDLEDVSYVEKSILVANAEEVIFSSDGFSEVFRKSDCFKKHDDLSAIMVRFKKQKEDGE